ncbi:hypothetical protein L810_2781 [Burkholderia sp. AU4i]|nr:hypothetical protein L810_2781 [Burkholderia sp. AU4i]
MVFAAPRADRVDLLGHVARAPEPPQPAQQRRIVRAEFAQRKHAEAARREHGHQRAVLEFSGHAGHDPLTFQPPVEARAQRRMRGRQQHGQLGEALRKVLPRGRRDECRGAVPVDRRRDEPLARHAQVRTGRRALAGQHEIEMMQRELREQRVVLALVAQQPQRGGSQHGCQDRVRGKLGDTVREADRKPHGRLAGRRAHLVGDQPSHLEDRLRARKRGLAGVGHRDAASGRAQQLVPERLLELAHLRADGLHGHVEPRGRARKAAFLHDDPEVVQMSEIEHRIVISEKPNQKSDSL